jgi:hypothetical protein
MGEVLGMLPNTRFEAAHLAVWCANEFAHLETFNAVQSGRGESNWRVSAIT